MQKEILHRIFILVFCINFACSPNQNKPKVDEPFIVSHLPHIKDFERQDHGFCSSLEIDFEKSDNLKSALYWRCRLSLAKYRLNTDQTAVGATQYNLEISDLITKISLRLANTPESILTHENKKMDNHHHLQCISMGYIIATTDQEKIDDYFACRKALIEDQQLVPPYGNNDYLDYPNRSYNIGFVIDRRIDEDIKNYNAEKAKYPTCMKFNLYSTDFKSCTTAQDNSRACFATIDKKKFTREWEEKIACQKQSYSKFPNVFLKENEEEKARVERVKANSAFYNQHSLASIGLDEKQFGGDGKNYEKDDEKEKNINSKEGLYSKYELTKLRQKYIFACQKKADDRVKLYVENLKKGCADLEKFKIVGED